MDTKKCRECQISKTLEDFSFRDKAQGIRSNICKTCQSTLSKRHYQEHRQEYNSRRYKHSKEYRNRNRKWVLDYLMEHPCVDCGEPDPIVLQFDHVRGKKENTVSRLISLGCPTEQISEEIQKCEVRCANCHTKRTAKVALWYRDGQRA